MYFSVPRRFFYVFYCFIHSHCIFLPFFLCHFIKEKHYSSFLESIPCSVVPHFVILHFITHSGKATFRTRLQRQSSCCCLRQYSTTDCACQDIHISYTHIQFGGLTPTPAHGHPQQSATSRALPLLLGMNFVVFLLFNVTICFSV